jgi:hypothetical protein
VPPRSPGRLLSCSPGCLGGAWQRVYWYLIA